MSSLRNWLKTPKDNIEATEVSAKFFDEAMDKVKPKSVSDEEELIQYY